MLFNSYVFLLAFLPIVLAGWWLLPGRAPRLAFLTLASYVFYSAWRFPTGLVLLPLLIASTTIDYVAGGIISRHDERPRVRTVALWVAIGCNLALLALFKYLGFFEGTVDAVANALTGTRPLAVHSLLLPIGISFYTFNSMSYTIDIYRRKVRPASSMLEYATFVALFPHLVAGPIVRFAEIESQLRSLRSKLGPPAVSVGVYFLVVGLFKKLAIADTLAPTVDGLFAHSGDLGFVAGWSAAFGYALQLYFDFSGYSDMAVGLAALLGFRFPQNFDSPYKAANIADFWRRWHITLSRWMRDYVFIPLGGSHGGRARTARNLLVTMFLGGLWHGAAWVFVLWGLGHGLLLAVHGVVRDRSWVPRWPRVWRALTLLAVVALWVPFRAGSLPHSFATAGNVLGAMAGLHGSGTVHAGSGSTSVPGWFLALVAALVAFVLWAPNSWEFEVTPRRKGLAVALGVMLAASIMLLPEPSPFLYFRF